MPPTVASCPKRVLLIDDNADLAESLGAVLGMSGHCVEVAFDGLYGLEKARSFLPHVIICDLGLPLLDGFAVAKIIKCDPQLRRVRLIALSAYDEPEKALLAGFDRYLLKPPNLRELTQLLAD